MDYIIIPILSILTGYTKIHIFRLSSEIYKKDIDSMLIYGLTNKPSNNSLSSKELEKHSSFVPLDDTDLSNILCIRDTRTMLNGNVFSWENNYYQILDKDNSIKQVFKGTELKVYEIK